MFGSLYQQITEAKQKLSPAEIEFASKFLTPRELTEFTEEVEALQIVGSPEAIASAKRILEKFKSMGDAGHSESFDLDGEQFGFDGDGSAKLYSIWHVKPPKDKPSSGSDGHSLNPHPEDSDDGW